MSNEGFTISQVENMIESKIVAASERLPPWINTFMNEVTKGFDQMRGEMQQMGNNLETGLRSEMQQMGNNLETGLRSEMQQMGNNLRSEMQQMGNNLETGLRSEMQQMGNNLETGVRSEMHMCFQSFYKHNDDVCKNLTDIVEQSKSEQDYQIAKLKNKQKRIEGFEASPVPFLDKKEEERTNLLPIGTCEEIENLEEEECKEYLRLYNVDSEGFSGVDLKCKLRDAVACNSLADMVFKFSEFSQKE